MARVVRVQRRGQPATPSPAAGRVRTRAECEVSPLFELTSADGGEAEPDAAPLALRAPRIQRPRPRGRRQSGASAVPLRNVLPRTYDAVNELLFALSERHPLSIRPGKQDWLVDGSANVRIPHTGLSTRDAYRVLLEEWGARQRGSLFSRSNNIAIRLLYFSSPLYENRADLEPLAARAPPGDTSAPFS
ncbi:hypothetical protein EMIHUDRAFT_442846, partial [Emiliania huxleyi CCMP1516]